MTTTIRSAGSMPASLNAFSKARRWLSVSTVPPDLLETTTTVSAEPVLDGRPHEVGVGGVEHGELDAGGLADHLRAPATSRPCRTARRARGPARAAATWSAAISGTSAARRLGQGHPGEPLAGLVLGRRAPQRAVLAGDPARDLVGRPGRPDPCVSRLVGVAEDSTTRPETVQVRRDTAPSGPRRSRPARAHDFENLSTPSCSSTTSTSSKSMPTAASRSKTCWAQVRAAGDRCRRGPRRGRRTRPSSSPASC